MVGVLLGDIEGMLEGRSEGKTVGLVVGAIVGWKEGVKQDPPPQTQQASAPINPWFSYSLSGSAHKSRS